MTDVPEDHLNGLAGAATPVGDATNGADTSIDDAPEGALEATAQREQAESKPEPVVDASRFAVQSAQLVLGDARLRGELPEARAADAESALDQPIDDPDERPARATASSVHPAPAATARTSQPAAAWLRRRIARFGSRGARREEGVRFGRESIGIVVLIALAVICAVLIVAVM